METNTSHEHSQASEKDSPRPTKEDRKVFRLSDDFIGIIREILQLALLTGTNIVDHLRGIQVEENPATGRLVPTEEYVEAYNAMIEDLERKAELAQAEQEKQQQNRLVNDPPSPSAQE
jgi:hypothetical protein